ncbi:MAG: class II aldolase/adducin family protein, partial [Dehalococcoidia bacterium]
MGPEVAITPYIRPGFALSRQVAERAGASAVVLAKHGLVTWGETQEELYGRTLELVARAEAYLAERECTTPAVAPDLDAGTTESLLLTLRGLLSRDGRRILHVDRTQRVFADRSDVDLVATAARATPDHILRIGARSLVVHDSVDVALAVAAFEEGYGDYFTRHRHRLPPELEMLSPLPRVVLVPGLGCVAAGPDARAARVNAEIAARSHLVTARVLDAFGAVDWLHERDIFDFDYWPLELAKLQAAPPPREFSGHVAIVAGAGNALGYAVATRLARDGAHLVLSGGDVDRLRQIAAAVPAETSLIAEGYPIATAIAAFGGVDVFIALDPMTLGDQHGLRTTFGRQSWGGVVVGLDMARGATVDLGQAFGAGVRT